MSAVSGLGHDMAQDTNRVDGRDELSEPCPQKQTVMEALPKEKFDFRGKGRDHI